jgi:prepilin-type N-terminal cleavage/methylation domain-containing protein
MIKLWPVMMGRRQGGMTLVEIMVALIILAIALSWLAPLIIIAMRGTRRGADLTEATTAAQDKLEEFRNRSYTYLLNNPTGQDTLSAVVRSWTITEESGHDGLLHIALDLSWQDEEGDAHQIQFVTLQARAK